MPIVPAIMQTEKLPIGKEHNFIHVSNGGKRKIGFVSQNFYFLPRMSVLQNVSLPLLFEGNDKLERYERAAWALKTVGLDHCMKHRPSILTVAQRQQAAIARTIIHDPDIILVDEPTGNLQPELSYEIRNTLRRLNRQG